MSVGTLSGLLQYFPKNRAILVQKLGADKKLSKSVSGYFMTKKKIPMAIKPEGKGGGGKALMARPLREELFLWLPKGRLKKKCCLFVYLSFSMARPLSRGGGG